MSTPRRALIVIDVQNEYFTGKLGISYPDPAITLPNVGRAMDAAGAAGIPVVVVQHITPPGTPIFAEGSHGAALHPSIAERPRDHLISKQLASAFTGTGLADWLRARDIDTVSIVGYMTHNCDAATVLHASHDGWQVELLGDASGSLPYRNRAGSASAEEIHRVFTVVMQTGFAAVVTTDDWIAAVQAGQPVAACEGVLGSHLQAVTQ
ncbi:cysteine hydrolase family protein [Vogesella indigofera]|uniref:cysteine hydrolase family protein n=1 Tax=Vogesella indigofera TaxID=45465 RepID=UPI00234E15B8|nr:cysteine hydrolase family protein [Vogesella indigofera]MDC7703847.1 cysteine hydrolase family protein [Vogesella indigofera]